ncbi:TetR/AcrR family transcriptional regulator [Sphingomonas oryzagri]
MISADPELPVRLPPRSTKGGRPSREIATRLGEHILDTALEQFIKLGAERATMESIALAAKVSKRTLYTRFGSRAGLLAAAIGHGAEHLVHPFSKSIPSGSLREQLLHVGRYMLDASLDAQIIGLEQLVMWVVDHQPELHDQLYTRIVHAPISLIQRILQEAEQKGEPVVDSSLAAASLVYDTLVSCPRRRILLRLGLENRRNAKQAYLEKSVDLLLGGIARR